MSAQHTPAPWYTGKGRGKGTIYADGAQVATTDGTYFAGLEPEVNEANARLIKAAPKLLEACELVMTVKYLLKGNMPIEYAEAIEKCRAAIAEAKGEAVPE